MTMKDLARHIIAVANENNIPVTNLQLQKVMYFTLQQALNNDVLSRTFLEETYNEPFLVWRYGPVIESIYDEYRMFGADPIVETDELIPEFSSLNNSIRSLLDENAFDLVERSHREPFWREREPQINGWRSHISYSLNDIQRV